MRLMRWTAIAGALCPFFAFSLTSHCPPLPSSYQVPKQVALHLGGQTKLFQKKEQQCAIAADSLADKCDYLTIDKS